MPGYLEEIYEAIGLELNVGLAGPNFLTLLSAVSAAPMIATLPASVVQQDGPLSGLEISTLPLAIPPLSIELI